MGTMNKMRENTGIVLWILVFAFGIIWVLQDSGGLDVIGNQASINIVMVDGDPITYDEYSNSVQLQIENYQEQTGETMLPQSVDQAREGVYQALVDNKLREHEMDRIGIQVTDDEVYDMILGDNPHSIIKLYFGDGEGNVNQALLQNFIDNPEARTDWIQIEDYLRSERRREKMENLISATVRVSEQDVLDEYYKNNLRATAQWVGLRYASIADDSVEVTDRELRNAYQNYREDFKREQAYSLDYVTRTKEASAEDSTHIFEDMTRIRTRFMETDNDSTFLAQNASERPYTDAWFNASDLDPEIASAIFEAPTPGRVTEPVFSNDQIHVIKIIDTQPSEEISVRASHILLRAPEENIETHDQLLALRQRIDDGEAFADIARAFSQDGTNVDGGDLGWFGPDQMVDEFEDAAFNARIGNVVGPIKTQYGYHLILVTARAENQVRVADFAMTVRPDIGTLNRMQELLEDLRYFAEETGDFRGEAERLHLPVQDVQVEDQQMVIPGIGTSRSITNFMAAEEVGAVSEVIELDDVYIVVHLADITPEGYRPLEDVRAEIEPRVRNEKKAEIQRERLADALAEHGFDGTADALGTNIRTSTDITFNMTVIPNLGREPKFSGTVLGMRPGQISQVIQGETSVYVIKLTELNEPGEITETQRNLLKTQLLTQRRNQVTSQWLASLRSNAEIEDFRFRFRQ